MTELQALAISSRFASSGYWFSMKKLEDMKSRSVGKELNHAGVTGIY